jgi:hypothetical protein
MSKRIYVSAVRVYPGRWMGSILEKTDLEHEWGALS